MMRVIILVLLCLGVAADVAAEARIVDSGTAKISAQEPIKLEASVTKPTATQPRRRAPKLTVLGYRNPNGELGFSQRVRVEEPSRLLLPPSSLSRLSLIAGTSATATVKVLGVQMSFRGTPVGGRLRYSTAEPNGEGEVDPQSFVPMFSDGDLVVGAEQTVTIGTGGEPFTLEARSALSFFSPITDIHPNLAMKLLDGMDLSATVLSKNVQPARQGQLTIPEVISGFYDSNTDTIINLGPSRALYLFELGSLNSSTGACDDEHCDFQDVVLLVTTNGGINEGETVEFDWIGPNDDLTFDMSGACSFDSVTQYCTPGTVFTLNESRKLKEIRSIVWGSPNGPQPPPLETLNYQMLVWNTVQAYLNGNGDPATATHVYPIGLPTNDQPMPGPPCNGQIQYLCPWSFNWTGSAWVPTYNFQWNLIQRVAEPIVLTSGEWVVSIIEEGNGTATDLWSVFSSADSPAPTGVWSAPWAGHPANWNYNHEFESGNPLPDNWGTYLSTVQP